MSAAATLTWLVRYGHVAAGALWLGGYLVLAFLLVPALAKRDTGGDMGGDTGNNGGVLERLAMTTVRVLSYTGTATIFFGLLLVPRTRGYGSLLGGEWGGIVVSCIVIAVALLGLGDSALRPALRRLKETHDVRPARRLALLGFALSLLAGGLMTRALYAPT